MVRVRFSMAGLMGLVFLLAVGMAALKSANKLWAVLVTTFVMGVLLFAVLGIAYSSGPMRRFWSGFALFGWSYLVFIYAPWFSRNVGGYIPAADLLHWLHSKMAKAQAPALDEKRITIWVKSDGTYWLDGQDVPDDAELIERFRKVDAVKKHPGLLLYFDPDSSPNGKGAEGDRIYRLLMPKGSIDTTTIQLHPRADFFERVGHSFTALLAGFIGGLMARLLLRNPEDKMVIAPKSPE